MTDQIDGEEGLPEEELPEVEGGEAEAPPAVDPELQAEARKYGWKPKEEFDRDPSGWVDADRFLTLPATQVKVMRDSRRELEKQLRDRDDRISRIEGMSKVAIERARQQEREAYEQKLQSIETAKREAAEVGDVERYDALSKAQKAISPPQVETQPAPQVAAPDPALGEYMASAKWVKDPHAYQIAYAAIEANPEVKMLPPLKQVQWAEKKVREYFPEHFDAPQEKPVTTSKVDGGGMGGFQKRGKGADDLPPEARKVAQDFVKEGIFKTVDEYAKDYFAQETGR